MKPSRAGFSLVEVTLAIGIVSFALLAVVGLLPTGLRSVKHATEEAAAVNVLQSLETALRTARLEGGTFSNTFAGKDIIFGTQPADFEWSDLTLEGTESSLDKRLAARVSIFESPQSTRPGRAVISVAWSANANPAWNAQNNSWSGAEGSLTTGVQFLPRP